MKFKPDNERSARRRRRAARKKATAFLPYAAKNRSQLARAMRWLRNNCPPGQSIYVPDDRWNYIRRMIVSEMGWNWKKFKVSRPEKISNLTGRSPS